MKPDTSHSRVNPLGDKQWILGPEVVTTTLKRLRQKLGYCSVFAALPGLVTSQVPTVHSSNVDSDAPKVSEPVRPSRPTGLRPRSRALMRLQSRFLLPHQRGNFSLLPAFAGSDNCPGAAIPGGNYTVASPYTDSGDTTGSNNTVDFVFDMFYFYYYWDARGPDQIYSFTLTETGPNAKIEVTTSSNTYKPMVYVLHGLVSGGCPSGTGNQAFNLIAISDSRWFNGNVATLQSPTVNSLPLNTPLYLAVDSAQPDAAAAGAYTLKMQDVKVAPASCPNPVACPEMFVRQHYLDFLNRVADQSGLVFWTNEITQCGGNGDCAEVKRINVSAAFFLSIEFQESGYLVHRMYKAAYGDIPNTPVPLTRQEFLPDTQRVGRDVVVNSSDWEQILENNKIAFANEFVQRVRFRDAFPTTMSPVQFVDKLNSNTGNALSQVKRDQLVNDFRTGTITRAQVLRAVAEDPDFERNEFNKAFVLMQYFGYLQRNPNEGLDTDFTGYNFWLTKLNQFNGNFVAAEMVKAFLNSDEYRRRFSP